MNKDGRPPNRWRRYVIRFVEFIFESTLGHIVGSAAFASLPTLLAYVAGIGWQWDAIIFLSLTATGLVVLVAVHRTQLHALRRWSDLTSTTNLVAFASKNEGSDFMPKEILKRRDLRHLAVMGNGCSKWTQKVDSDEAIAKFKRMREDGGTVKFLAASPLVLMKASDEVFRAKARRNANSLVKLREFRMKSTSWDGCGAFDIRLYEHLATLRLIIVNETECIVGHYKEDVTGDSLDTPLLVFRRAEGNEWGFGHAFCRLFIHEWHRCQEPTTEQWDEIERIARS